MFVYLNDVQAGGETHFSKLGLKISPKKRMACVHFPSYLPTATDRTIYTDGEDRTVIDRDMRGKKDARAIHEACEVSRHSEVNI